ncbi:hypothetical protein AAV98_01740 [Bacillus sp. CHD6a]|nr:hypothetical protein AAV98_01740 [Bacillus sp. CHD6a]
MLQSTARIWHLVDVVEGAQTPRGRKGQVRPRKAKPEEAQGPPAGKRSAWNGNQLDLYLSKKKCTLIKGTL